MVKHKKAEVIKLLTKGEKIIYLIHCTCGNYHICIQTSKDCFEIVDTARSKKQGDILYKRTWQKLN